MDATRIARPEDVGLSSRRLALIEGWMQRLVADGKLPGVLTMVSRRGQTAWLACHGQADIARAAPMRPDTIVRIYSMTKPLASVAIMMLYEEGHFQLDDPITRFLPCFADMRVCVGGARGKIETAPANRDITFRDLLTHTSGLTYGFMEASPVDALYREHGVDFQTSDATLAELVEKAAALPLLAQPGSAWNYSIATDVLGHLVATISGQSFASFLHERVIGPLGMKDTGFHVPPEKLARFAANYTRGADGRPMLIDDPQKSRFGAPRAIASGGGGLVSTAGDYMRFCQMMLNKGTLSGTRLLGRKTVELMTMNHLGGDMADMGQARFSESPYTGIGFGLGFSVMLDPAKAQILGTPGEYAWGGAASTAFWIDPAEELAVVMLTQLTPSSTYPIRRELRVLTYQAIID
ncbi:MAG: beta-lactamase family protein [Rhodospirillales bacterium]|nr:beta-lactamase family protein [Rhodospirillales bacterium]MDE2199172.1 beta-lactamase family protein [Rhodospirillales bacterium]MDE2574536.1 beta-lactamase family protein [Rhodospirillales bacterium]